MMTTLKVQRRNMETKAKELRRQGYVTGNLFGKEIEASIPLKIEKRDVLKEASYILNLMENSTMFFLRILNMIQ